MFGLGFWEIITILVVIIVFIKPKDLPVFFRKAGRLYTQLKTFSNRVILDMESTEEVTDIKQNPEHKE